MDDKHRPATVADLPWGDMSQELRMKLLETMTNLTGRFQHPATEEIPLDLLPKEEVIAVINRFGGKNSWQTRWLGRNFGDFIAQELTGLAEAALTAIEAGQVWLSRNPFPFGRGNESSPSPFLKGTAQLYARHTGYDWGARLTARDEIVSGQTDAWGWHYRSWEFDYDLSDELTRRWLRAAAVLREQTVSSWTWKDNWETRHQFQREEWSSKTADWRQRVIRWLEELATGNNKTAWYAQEVLGRAICPLCKQVAEGREPKLNPEPCDICSAAIAALPHGRWCTSCQQVLAGEQECRCTNPCIGCRGDCYECSHYEGRNETHIDGD